LASCLLALLAALGTGLPSHHHHDTRAASGETWLISADHHTHATRLVEQDDRVPSGGLQGAVATSIAQEPTAPLLVAVETVPDQLPRARERAPPPGAPRAPPHRI
jgi:hypothetical protein